uniref:Myocardin related transcription factor A n=1 Tax=Salvator merianae TaxID=96440 RepID=A0A8D0DRK7_SALMN
MPPLKSPAAFHEQRRSLERARTEDYLKRKIRSRPERSELVRMHILEETSAEPSLQAKQLKLKRARLADDLNEKIAQRPGPMELVEKNILPVESSLKEAIIVGQVNYPKVADNSSFEDDSSDALSPEQPASHESLGSVPSPMEARVGESVPPPTATASAQVICQIKINADSSETAFVSEQPPTPLPPAPPPVPPNLSNGVAASAAKPLPPLIKQSQSKSSCEKSQRSKKSKEPKPKVKKLKYHQYIPPDQKQDKGAPPMDSSYAKILQQQQLFLQLQILNQQQQQHYNYQTILPAPPKPPGEQQSGNSAPPMRSLSTAVNSTSSVSSSSNGLMRQNSNASAGKPGPLPINLDDMKVAELKQELKLRALPVSGTKTDLIERLKSYQEHNCTTGRTIAATKPNSAILPKAAEVVVAFPTTRLNTAPALVSAGITSAEVVVATVTGNSVMKFGSTGSTPPVSPTSSERSLMSAGDENSTSGDAFGEMVTSPLTQLTLQASPVQFLVKEENAKGTSCSSNPVSKTESSIGSRQDMEVQDKDQMLQEKDKQIEELTRMLKQKQQLVEMLKLQLEREKRSQQPSSAMAVGEEGTTTLPETTNSGTQVKSEKAFMSCQSTGQANCQTDQLKSTQTTSQMDTSETRSVPKKAVMVKQEVSVAETEPSCQTSSFFLGQQSGGFSNLIKGTPSPPLITDSTGTHIALAMTNQNAERQGLSPQDKVRNSSLSSKGMSSPPTKASAKQPVSSPNSSLQQPSSEPAKKLRSPSPPSPSQMDLEQQNPSFFGNPAPLLLPATSVLMKEPPGYEEAVKQQPKPPEENGCSSQHMDDLFDILIEHGEISAQFKEQSAPARKDTISPGCTSPSSSHHSSELPLQVLMNHSSSINPSSVGRLEDFLESTTGLPLLTAGPDGPEPLSLIDLYSEMLSSSAILDHPSSPMDTSELHFAPEPTGGPNLDLGEANLDSMDWLELPGGPVMSLTPLSTATPSLFSTDFLDGHDLQLHWDSCL